MARAHQRPLSQLLLALALAALACAAPASLLPTARPVTRLPAAPTTVPGATPRSVVTPATGPFGGEPVAGAAERLPSLNPFAPFSASAASARDPALPRHDLLDLEKLPYLQQLSTAQQDALLAHGFVIGGQPFPSFAAAYAFGADQKLPAFVTADAILHAFQVVADVAWQRSQARFLTADLQALSHNMVVVSEEQWHGAGEDSAAQAALHNFAFFAVASSLIDPAFTPPPPVAQVVSEELTLIAQGGRFISPLFGVEENYDRLRPRGHYAQDESMSRYFRALSWLARPLSFSYAPAANNSLEPLAQARSAARQALLVTWGLEQSNNLTRWQRIFEPTLFFEGTTVAWSVAQVQAVSSILFGAAPVPDDLAADPLLDDFLATMHTMPPTLSLDTDALPAFALLPAPYAQQAAAPDAAVFRQLTYNRVGAYTGAMPLPRTAIQTAIGPIRGLPRTLDVAAVLGSPLAAQEVTTAGDAAYEGYDLQFEQLQQHYAALDPAAWTLSFDGGWLFALQPLLMPLQDGFLYAPAGAWQSRQLAAWHVGWLALRHETTLASRPVAAVTISPEVAYGYLEPQPLLYARLAALAGQIHEGLASRDLLDEESAGKLQQLERLLDAARAIARKQLAAQRLGADEALLLGQFTTRLQNLTTYQATAGDAVPLTESSLPRLVDVHVEPSSGRVLQAAAGEALPIYILIPREQGIDLALGAIQIPYELHGEQLSPSAWRELQNPPPSPSWLQPYIVGATLDN